MASSIRKSRRALWMVAWLDLAVAIFAGGPRLQADLAAGAKPKARTTNTTTGSVVPTALASDVTAEVDRGGETTIHLRGVASGGGQVAFRLLQKPRHGRIVRSRPLNLDTLEVVYRHSGGHAAAQDTIVFAVRAGATGPFSPGQATIRIKEVPGRLLAPEALDFPPVVAGNTATDSFILANDGGAPLAGTITATAPWEVSGSQTFDLPPGKKRKIVVLFRPDREGTFRGRIEFEAGERTSVDLTGQSTAPFRATPTALALRADASGKTGLISLQNNSSGPVEIQITSDFPLPKNVVLQFGETRELLVEDRGGEVASSVISFSSGAFTTRVTVSSSPKTAGHEPQTP